MADSRDIAGRKEPEDIVCFEDRQEILVGIEGWSCMDQAGVGVGKSWYCCCCLGKAGWLVLRKFQG